jgi:hypothetical protein
MIGVGCGLYPIPYSRKSMPSAQSCGPRSDTRKAKLIKQDTRSWTQQKKLDETPCYGQLVTYKASDGTTTAMFRRGPLTSVIWSSVTLRMR